MPIAVAPARAYQARQEAGPMRIAALIVAAGRGTRAGGETPKQYRPLAGRAVLAHSLAAFSGHPRIDEVSVVVAGADMARLDAVPEAAGLRRVPGGADRAASVRAGLAALAEGVTHVLVHDGARPLVAPALIDRVIAGLGEAPAAAPALAVSDALWHGVAGRVTAAAPRDGLYRAQTPQGFALSAIRAAHGAHSGAAADDVEVALAHGLDVAIVEGDEDNIKITRPGDFARAARLLKGPRLDVRTGTGFDVHRFGPGAAVTLCGVAIPHDRGLAGHSDADVAMHALTDAIYGALAEGDIGRHFPPDDPAWRDAESRVFLQHAAGLAAARGYGVGNADVTLVCESPKIGPHAGRMAECLAGILDTGAGRIGVKATTSERLGFTGREEGIAALATVTLVAP